MLNPSEVGVVHRRRSDSTPHPGPLPVRGGEGEVAVHSTIAAICIGGPQGLVFRGVHVPAHLVGSGPKLGFKVEIRAVGLFLIV